MPRRPRTGVDPRRGRHRKAVSRETRAWVAEHAPPANKPEWMPEEVYVALMRLRRELEGAA